MRRRLGLLVVPVLLALAACSGGGGSDEPAASPAPSPSVTSAADPFVGTYDVTSVVDRTTLKGRGNNKGDKDRLVLVVSCVDDCNGLVMRGSIASGALSRTIALTEGDAVATGTRTRRGPCSQTANAARPGSFSETADYTLTPQADGIAGEVDYVFRGCGFDGISHLALTGTRTDEAPPYLPDEAAAALAGPVSTYDAAVATLYAGYNGCYNKPTDRTASCLVGLLRPWAATFGATEQALDGATGGGATCDKALGAVGLPALQRKVTATIQALGRRATQQTALNLGVPQLVGLLTTTHQALVTSLVLCVDPLDSGALGKDGTLASDVDGRLPVPADQG